MKIKALLYAILFSATSLVAQDEPQKRQEIGLSFNNFNNFGAAYRIGNDLALWRVSINLSTNSQVEEIPNDTIKNNTDDFFLDISLGWEKRIALADRLYFRLGGDLFYQNGQTSFERVQFVPFRQNSTTEISSNGYGVRLVFGAMYQINSAIHFGFEVLPAYSWINSERKNSLTSNTTNPVENSIKTSNSGFNLNTSSVRLNFGFNF